MRTAVVTPSYEADFERCRLLCDSMDVRLTGQWTHYILVEQRDLAKFAALKGPRRVIVDERELLPDWLRPFPDPLSLGKRRIWLGLHAPPMRGWHMQQLRKLGVGRLLQEEAMFFADSDVVLTRSFDPANLWDGDKMRLYRQDNTVTADMHKHIKWIATSSRLLGRQDKVVEPPFPDYVNTLIGWRTDTLNAMLDHIEQANGVNWMRAIGKSRDISEAMLYGCYVDEILGGQGHVHTSKALCHVMWFREGRQRNHRELLDFMAQMEPHQIGIGVQSFIGFSAQQVRQAVLP